MPVDDFDSNLDLDSFEADTDGFRSMRKTLEKALKKNKDLASELDGFKAEKTRQSVESILSSKNLNPLLADFYRESDTSETAVTAWAEKYAPLFSGAVSTAGGSEGEPVEDGDEPAAEKQQLTPDQQAARRMQGVLSTAQVPVAGIEAIEKAIGKAESREDVLKALGMAY